MYGLMGVNSRALSKCALAFEEGMKKQLPWWCIGDSSFYGNLANGKSDLYCF